MRSSRTACAPQILSNMVFRISISVSGCAQSCGHDREERRFALRGIHESMREVRIERDAIAIVELEAFSVDLEDEPAFLNDDRLATACLVQRRVSGRARA